MNGIITKELLERTQRALPRVRQWIDDLHARNLHQASPAISIGSGKLRRYFPDATLRSANTVATDQIPFPPVTAYGVPEFEVLATMNMAGITFDHMYFVHHSYSDTESIHCHELVHVIQWGALGPDAFLLTYALGILQHGYFESPLEAIAYDLQNRFERDVEVPALAATVTDHALYARDRAAQVFRGVGLTTST